MSDPSLSPSFDDDDLGDLEFDAEPGSAAELDSEADDLVSFDDDDENGFTDASSLYDEYAAELDDDESDDESPDGDASVVDESEGLDEG
jgi:hypothetical protein